MKFESSRVAELSMLSEGPRAVRHLDFGSRATASAYREALVGALDHGVSVTINFEGVAATQSFIDELIGVLVLNRGPDVLRLVKFRGCSDDVKAIIRFVASDRASQYEANRIRRAGSGPDPSALHAY